MTPFHPSAAALAIIVIAPASQTVGGTPYVFDSWSDGLPASHGFVTPATPFTLTATYVPG